MAYSRQLLNDGEEIVLDRNPYWTFMLGPVFMITATVFFTIVIAAFDWRWAWIGLIAILFALIGSVGRYLRWKTTQFVITTDRIIVRTGILSKAGMEIPLERVMNISFHQALWERMLHCGDLIIESAGENGHEPFSDVHEPAEVQNLLYRQMEIASNGSPRPDGLSDQQNKGGGDSRSPQGESIPEQISKLGELRDRGVLSDDEFQKKKRQLLDRM